jgi:hypothetical protein
MLSNIWKHPKTSAVGVLIAITTVVGVLTQQGVTLGKAGTGTVVALIGAIASAFLGLLSKDPESSSAPAASSQKVGALMLVALLITAPFGAGCNAKNVAQDIVNWTPALQSTVATVDSILGGLDPGLAPAFVAATAGFDAGSNLVVAQAKAYLANPSASILATLQTAVVTFQQSVNQAVLAAAGITNSANQKTALASINGVAAIVNAILALVTSVSGKAQVAAMAAHSPLKLAMVIQLEDRQLEARIVSAHYDLPLYIAAIDCNRTQYQLMQAGF